MVDPSVLNEILSYDPDTGSLTWLARDERFAKGYLQWNGKWADKPAFTTVGTHGYFTGALRCIGIDRELAHRVAWAMSYGAWPDKKIDHINGIKTDNRLSNLRVVSDVSNSRNQKRRSDNTSGYTGVYWNKQRRRWQALIKTQSGRIKHLGYFDDVEDAASARKQADPKHGYHENHGRVMV